MLTSISGVYIVTQTPFQNDGAIDLQSVDTLVDFYTKHGADGFTILGVAGEASKLTSDESIALANRFIRRAGKKAVIVGVSNPSLAQLTVLTKEVMDAGASGVMIAPPMGLKTEDELFSYFDSVFNQIGNVPVVLQDFPFSSGVWMSVASIDKLASQFSQIQAIKEEDIPSITKITKLRETMARRISILTGNNAMFLPLELGRGIDGPMAGFSHPEMISEVYQLYRANKVEHAHDVFNTYLPLLSYENQGQWGVAVRKEILKLRGAISCAAMRVPGPRLTGIEFKEIDLLLSQLNKSLKEKYG